MQNYIKTPTDLLFDKELKSTDKVIYQYLQWRQGNNGDCWPSETTIAADLHLSKRTVMRSLEHLESLHRIKIQKPKKQGRGQYNHYNLIKGDKNATFSSIKGDKNATFSSIKGDKSSIKRVTKSHKKGDKKSHKNKPVENNTKKTSLRCNSVEFQLSKLLLDLIIERKEDFQIAKRNTTEKRNKLLGKWAIHIDRLIRIDKKTPERIKQVIEWSQDNNFWVNNILSTRKLRKQFDQLEMKMKFERESEMRNANTNRKIQEIPAGSYIR